MDQDFYIEESSPLKIFLMVLFFGLLIAAGIYGYLNFKNSDNIKLKNISVELGDKLSNNINDYITGNNLNTYKLDVSNVSVDNEGKTNSTGEYSYKIIKNGIVQKGKLYVKDTTKPKYELEDLIVGVNEEFSPNDFLLKCEDLSLPCSVRFKKAKDLEVNKSEGVYKTIIIISDAAGNEEEKEVNITVKGENTLLNKKSSDLNYDHLSEIDNNWDQTYTKKLDKAISDESVEYSTEISKISIKEYDFTKAKKGEKILVVYNKYNYVIGFSIKITFEDDSILYITKDNAIEKEDITNE